MAQSTSSIGDRLNIGNEKESKSAHSTDAISLSNRNDSALPTFPIEQNSDGDPAQQIPIPPLNAS